MLNDVPVDRPSESELRAALEQLERLAYGNLAAIPPCEGDPEYTLRAAITELVALRAAQASSAAPEVALAPGIARPNLTPLERQYGLLLSENLALRATLALIGKHAEMPDQLHNWETKRAAIRSLVYAALGTERITIAMTEGAYGVLGD